MSEAVKMFPILRGQPIPWEVIEPFDHQAQSNHCGQTLKRLAERGGLGPCEAVAVLEERPWKEMDQEAAKRRLREIVEAHANSPLQVALRERDRLREEVASVKAKHANAEAWIVKQQEALKRANQQDKERLETIATLRGLLERALPVIKNAMRRFPPSPIIVGEQLAAEIERTLEGKL